MVSNSLIKVLQKDISLRWGSFNIENYASEKSYLDKQLALMDKILELKQYEIDNNIVSTKELTKKSFDPFNLSDLDDENEDDYSEAKLYDTVIKTFCDNPLVKAIAEVNPLSSIPAPKFKGPSKTAVAIPVKESLTNETVEESLIVYEEKFERNLRGGFLPNNKLFVPESIVRSIGAENGNIIRATEIKGEKQANGHPKFHFEVIDDSVNEKAQGRKQFNKCVVKSAGGRYYVDYSQEDSSYIRVNENVFAPVLSQEDIYNFGIKEGDIVDIAFYENNLLHVVCIWKHINACN